jgi:hypothetical protein
MGRLSQNLGATSSWNPHGLFRPVTGIAVPLLASLVLWNLEILFSGLETFNQLCAVEIPISQSYVFSAMNVAVF